MMPYLSDQEDEAISEILFTAQCIQDIQADFAAEHSAFFNIICKSDIDSTSITKDDIENLLKNIRQCDSQISRNWENIYLGLPNHATGLKLIAMFLKLKRMQHRLATEPWSEKLRQEVVATRELYLQTVQSSHYID